MVLVRVFNISSFTLKFFKLIPYGVFCFNVRMKGGGGGGGGDPVTRHISGLKVYMKLKFAEHFVWSSKASVLGRLHCILFLLYTTDLCSNI